MKSRSLSIVVLAALSACQQYPSGQTQLNVGQSGSKEAIRRTLDATSDGAISLDSQPSLTNEEAVTAIQDWLAEHPKIAAHLMELERPVDLSPDQLADWAADVSEQIPVEFSAREEAQVQEAIAQWDYVVGNHAALENDVAVETGVNYAQECRDARGEDKNPEAKGNGWAHGHDKEKGKPTKDTSECFGMGPQVHVVGDGPGELNPGFESVSSYRTLALPPSPEPSPTPIPKPSFVPYIPWEGLPGYGATPTPQQHAAFQAKGNFILSRQYVPLVKQSDNTRCSLASWAFMAGSNYGWTDQRSQSYYQALEKKYFEFGWQNQSIFGSMRYKAGVMPHDLVNWIKGEYVPGTNFSYCTGTSKTPLSTLMYMIDTFYRPIVCLDGSDQFVNTSAHWCVPIGYNKDYIITSESLGGATVRTSYMPKAEFIRAWSMTNTRNQLYAYCATLLPLVVDASFLGKVNALENAMVDTLNVGRLKPYNYQYHFNKGVPLNPSPPPTPTPTPLPAGSLSNVSVVGYDVDRVGFSSSTPDGSADIHLKFTFTSAGGTTVENVFVKDNVLYGGLDGWYSTSRNSFLGVALNGGKLLNSATTTSNSLVSLGIGKYNFDLYGAERGSFYNGNTYTINVTVNRNGIRSVVTTNVPIVLLRR